MEKSIIKTGKTIDAAKQAALDELKLDQDTEYEVEVLKIPKNGFLGIGACLAEVKVTYQVPDVVEKPAPALSSASRSKPKKPKQPVEAEAPKAPEKKAAPAPKAEPAQEIH